jgi:hypothetical protein
MFAARSQVVQADPWPTYSHSYHNRETLPLIEFIIDKP